MIFSKYSKQDILKLVEFSILMQSGGGIITKHPDYIIEKFEFTDGSGLLLDDENKAILKRWKEIFLSKENKK